MAQILHIFRKDLKHLWLSVLAVLGLIVSHAIVDARISPINHERDSFASVLTLLNLFLPMAIWFLIAQVIFQEAMPGEQQFWLTRPYSRIKLLAAKILFVVAFISVPLFLSDCCILAVQGLPVVGDLSQLLIRQSIVAAIFVLPSFAIAAVTTGLTQFVLAWLLLVFSVAAAEMLTSVIDSHHAGISVNFMTPSFLAAIAVVAAGVIVWQYAARRTVLARLILLVIVCTFLPIDSGRLLGTYFRPAEPTGLGAANGFDIRIAYDAGPRVPLGRDWQAQQTGYVPLRFPLMVSGLTANTELSGTVVATISAGGKSWPVSGGVYGGSVEKINGYYWQTIMLDVDTTVLKEVRQQRITLHTSYNLDVLNDEVETRISVTKQSFLVSDVGLCRSALDVPQYQLTCRSGLTRRPQIVVRLEPPTGVTDLVASFPENPLPWGLSPTTDLGVVPFSVERTDAKLAFIRRRKVGAFRSKLELKDIQLEDYMVR